MSSCCYCCCWASSSSALSALLLLLVIMIIGGAADGISVVVGDDDDGRGLSSNMEQYLLCPHLLSVKYGNSSGKDQPEDASAAAAASSTLPSCFFRGIWLLRVHSTEASNSDNNIHQYLLAGSKHCQARIQHHKKVKEATAKRFGSVKDWMTNSRMIVLFPEKNFQGTGLELRLEKNNSFSAEMVARKGDFYPKSSIIINSNWNIENVDGDMFCLLGEGELSLLPDWASEEYKPGPNVSFPAIFPGCYRRPLAVNMEPEEEPWRGVHFCHVLQLT
ncbi:unnamed protein product [Notodromas monacha]|uniref:Uncharacterized protein n=1 Tax=Notodromas monacha TaxID=399045 RepID=A0A7R9GF09_9CRUS|nr:unnamed protein product [Notodromas monacha]CAG0918385.1 unnamed protein product [Notodromas monacha]